jgi:4-amino-4-deoxy-L-arabinose transferase-like glycosyltransferase
MKTDDEWGEWASDFRHAKGAGPDPAEVIASARRGFWKVAGKMTIEVVAHVFAIVVFGVLSVKVPHLWPYASLVMPAFAASLAFTIHARTGTWKASAETVRAFVDLEWRRKRAELAVLRFSQGLLGVLVVGFAIWLPYFLASGQGRPDLGMAFLVARLVFAVATFVGSWLYIRHKIRGARERLARVEQVRASLVDGSASEVVL